MYTFFNIYDDNLEKYLLTYLEKQVKEIVWLCIGTNKIVGDSFGPIVGSGIYGKVPNVYGTLAHSVNAKNLNKYVKYIYLKHDKPFIVVIDSALGDKEYINNLVIGGQGIVPGKAMKRGFGIVGNMYIGAIVEQAKQDNYKQISKVNKKDVIQMSNRVIQAILGLSCFKEPKNGYTDNM